MIHPKAKTATKVLLLLLILSLNLFLLINFSNRQKTARIITSNFIGYDFARAVTNDEASISMLLKPGTESHDFEPTPADIINIKNADLFIYIGGESDSWINKLLSDNEISEAKTLRLMDLVEVKPEKLPEGLEESEEAATHHEHTDHNDSSEPEYDEHIWTSPVNAIKLVNGIRDKLSFIYPEHRSEYSQNAAAYTLRLTDIDEQIRTIVAASPKHTLIFGDRFPFQYFVDEYGLDYYAAFPGCSEQTEASSHTIAFLIDEIKANHINIILKIELTSDNLARTIAEETGAKVMILNAAHNISQTDFDSGVTYADIMTQNIETLKAALK